MRLAGLNYTKISCEKKSTGIDGLKIGSNVDIAEIEELKGEFVAKEQLITIKFKYSIDYNPNYAKIELEGNIILSAESKVVKDVLKDWKDKKISPDFKIGLFNLIIKKASIKALQLEDEMGLPYHMPFPSLKKQEEKKE